MMPADDKNITPESGTVQSEEQVPALLHHQASGLVKHTQALARLSVGAQQPDQTALIIATYLTAAAAIEAVLSETAHDCQPAIYTRAFRFSGIIDKYRLLMGGPPPDLLERIKYVRDSLTHSEPDNGRLGAAGNYMNTKDVAKAVEYVRELSDTVLRKFK